MKVLGQEKFHGLEFKLETVNLTQVTPNKDHRSSTHVSSSTSCQVSFH